MLVWAAHLRSQALPSDQLITDCSFDKGCLANSTAQAANSQLCVLCKNCLTVTSLACQLLLQPAACCACRASTAAGWDGGITVHCRDWRFPAYNCLPDNC
jgi:hypothetical protein